MGIHRPRHDIECTNMCLHTEHVAVPEDICCTHETILGIMAVLKTRDLRCSTQRTKLYPLPLPRLSLRNISWLLAAAVCVGKSRRPLEEIDLFILKLNNGVHGGALAWTEMTNEDTPLGTADVACYVTGIPPIAEGGGGETNMFPRKIPETPCSCGHAYPITSLTNNHMTCRTPAAAHACTSILRCKHERQKTCSSSPSAPGT